jgi:hypothetical protein
MAQMVMCDGPEQGPAVFMITNIEQAETQALCLDCMIGFSAAFLQAVAPGMIAKPELKPARKPRAKAGAAAAAAGSDGQAVTNGPADQTG